MAVIREYLIDHQPEGRIGAGSHLFQVEADVSIDDVAETVKVEIGQVEIWVPGSKGGPKATTPWVVLADPLPEWLQTYLTDQVLDLLRTDGAEYDATLAAQNEDEAERALEAQAGL
jgi:hypothetical protein